MCGAGGGLGLTQGEVGRRVGRGRVAVSNLMRLLELPDDAVDLLDEGKLTEGHGRALLLVAEHSIDADWRRRPLRAAGRCVAWKRRHAKAMKRTKSRVRGAVAAALFRWRYIPIRRPPVWRSRWRLNTRSAPRCASGPTQRAGTGRISPSPPLRTHTRSRKGSRATGSRIGARGRLAQSVRALL